MHSPSFAADTACVCRLTLVRPLTLMCTSANTCTWQEYECDPVTLTSQSCFRSKSHEQVKVTSFNTNDNWYCAISLKKKCLALCSSNPTLTTACPYCGKTTRSVAKASKLENKTHLKIIETGFHQHTQIFTSWEPERSTQWTSDCRHTVLWL